MLTRADLLNRIESFQKDLARDEIDSRHVPKRAKASREAHLHDEAGNPVDRPSEATIDSLEAFLAHLEGVRPRWENEQRADELLSNMEMTPRMIAMLKKKLKGAKK